MIHFISGKPRAGKSFYAVTHLVKELTDSTRQVVTNLALDLDALQHHLLEVGCDKLVADWVRILDEAETREFWRFRVGFDIPDDRPRDAKGKAVGLLDFGPWRERILDGEGRPTVYYIDEVHEFYNARNWQKTGEDALHYLSQHGKLGDDVFPISQSISLVDKQFTTLSQDFTYVRNKSLEKFGVFKGKNAFQLRVFLTPDKGTQRPCETHHFVLDQKIANCYDTASGVGVHGVSADKGQRPKGLPWWTIYAGGAVAMAALWLGVWQAPKAIGSMATRLTEGVPVASERMKSEAEPERFQGETIGPVVQVSEWAENLSQ